MELRLYQLEAANKMDQILEKYGVVYLAGEVRVGKTLIALTVAQPWGNVLFVTKKKAIDGIAEDAHNLGFEIDARHDMNFLAVNYEGLHKVDKNWANIVIIDESHSVGAFPKPIKAAKLLKELCMDLPVILMSGTPSPESFAQLFHQFWVTVYSPWRDYSNFYKWAKEYVNVKQKMIGFGRWINDYSEVKPEAIEEFNKYSVSVTQEAAGFNGKVVETIHRIPMPDNLLLMLSVLKKTKLLTHRKIELTADTGAKMMSMTHQLSSGTIIDDYQVPWTVSDYKLKYLIEQFKGLKIAIFYVYNEEGELLKSYYKNWTDSPRDFNRTKSRPFICQVSAGREGTNLSTADAIIFYSISHSAVSYWQARARSQSKDGGDKQVHWLFGSIYGKKSIEEKIYEVVQTKKNFTLKHFMKQKLNIKKNGKSN